MPQTARIKSLPVAFEMLETMQAEGVDWGEDYRAGARQARAEPLEGRRGQLIDQHLERMAELGEADRRDGCYRRHLLTELGDLELAVPRTRTFSALKVVRAYARRAHNVDRMILACFVLGLSTRKVATALLPVLGRPVSPATVSLQQKGLRFGMPNMRGNWNSLMAGCTAFVMGLILLVCLGASREPVEKPLHLKTGEPSNSVRNSANRRTIRMSNATRPKAAFVVAGCSGPLGRQESATGSRGDLARGLRRCLLTAIAAGIGSELPRVTRCLLPFCRSSVPAVANGSADVRAREADILQHGLVHPRR